MLPANRHLLPVLGIDIHIVLIGGVPVPVPHPFIGLVLDISDYIPFIGSTINVNGLPRGNSSVNGMLALRAHIPMGGPFAMPFLIGHDSVNFFGSLTVKAQDALFSAAGYMVMSCSDIGLPLTVSPGKKLWNLVPHLYLPTSTVIPIPAGNPVMVGGPYVPDFESMQRALAMSFGFGALLKGAGRALNRISRRFNCTRGLADHLCKTGFEPVDLVTGRVIYEGTDFELAGPLPVSWQRSWYSDSGYEGPMGHGTHCCYDLSLVVDEVEQQVAVVLPDGRETAFPLIPDGQSTYNRPEKLTLTR
ncbi:hypothetical protein EXU57_21555, partial [Segetibacter sp. 3557_3]|uniref:DUF6531 domain-containing protein n=1 Tax=Segetibacter sp. 3557_3 TaxID=2547429 RepID=UPI0010E1A547